MAYDQDIGLASKLSWFLRGIGLSVQRSKNESSFVVRSTEGGQVVVECMKNHPNGVQVDMWKAPGLSSDAATIHLQRFLRSAFRKAGLAVAGQ